MRLKFVLLAIVVVSLLLSGASCRQPAGSPKKSIVVTYSVLGSVVRELVGDQATVLVPMPNGLDPHEWEPSPKDIEAFNKADLVVENGLGNEGGLEKTLQAARDSGVRFFTASDHIDIRYVGPGEGIPSDDPDQIVGAPDPHLWVDPLAMKSVVAALAPRLKQELGLDVDQQSTELQARLDALDAEIAGMAAAIPPGERKLVTGHESLGYFAQRYGFELVGVIIPSLSSQAGVSAADLAVLKLAIQENQVEAIFTELGTPPAVARAIGEETGVAVVELGTHALPLDGSYFTFMRGLAGAIAGALR